MNTSILSLMGKTAPVLAGALFLLLPDISRAQGSLGMSLMRPTVINNMHNGMPRPPFAGSGQRGIPANGLNNLGASNPGGSMFNQNQGILANQTNTRTRFAINTSISDSGVLNSALDSVTEFGTALNSSGQGNMNIFGGFGNNAGMNFGMAQNGLGTLLKQPPGVIVNALFNGSTNFAIFGNQHVGAYQGAVPQYGFPGIYGAGSPGPYAGKGFGNGDNGY